MDEITPGADEINSAVDEITSGVDEIIYAADDIILAKNEVVRAAYEHVFTKNERASRMQYFENKLFMYFHSSSGQRWSKNHISEAKHLLRPPQAIGNVMGGKSIPGFLLADAGLSDSNKPFRKK